MELMEARAGASRNNSTYRTYSIYSTYEMTRCNKYRMYSLEVDSEGVILA